MPSSRDAPKNKEKGKLLLDRKISLKRKKGKTTMDPRNVRYQQHIANFPPSIPGVFLRFLSQHTLRTPTTHP